MSVINNLSIPQFTLESSLNDMFREPTKEEKAQWEMQHKMAELKAKHEQFLRDREHKERRLLYAIAEKLGIDTESI